MQGVSNTSDCLALCTYIHEKPKHIGMERGSRESVGNSPLNNNISVADVRRGVTAGQVPRLRIMLGGIMAAHSTRMARRHAHGL